MFLKIIVYPRIIAYLETGKRKGEEITSANEFEKWETEESTILKLKKHLEQKTCPKSLQYKAWGNVTPNDMFQKEIGAIKQYAEKTICGSPVTLPSTQTRESHEKVRKGEICQTPKQD